LRLGLVVVNPQHGIEDIDSKEHAITAAAERLDYASFTKAVIAPQMAGAGVPFFPAMHWHADHWDAAMMWLCEIVSADQEEEWSSVVRELDGTLGSGVRAYSWEVTLWERWS